MSSRTLWFIVSPLYRPAPGGAAVYYDTLARALAEDGADVVVATEAYPGQPATEQHETGSGSLGLRRLFPFRAGRSQIDFKTYVAYAVQNLKMLGLPRMLADEAAARSASGAVVVIHSSFFYKPGVLPRVISALRRQLPGRTKLVVDVRDPLFDDSLFPVLARFDAAIGCSRAIADRLRAGLPESVAVHHIPIPFAAPPVPKDEVVSTVLGEHGLADVPYLLNPNGVLETKAYPLMLDVVRELRKIPGHERTKLVTIGRSRDWRSRDDAAVAEGVLKYLGPVPNGTMLALAKGAFATLVLSEVEGLPRSALETISVGTPLLGPAIPEFEESIPGAVARSRNAAELAAQVVMVSETRSSRAYPIQRHDMRSLVSRYRELEPA